MIFFQDSLYDILVFCIRPFRSDYPNLNDVKKEKKKKDEKKSQRKKKKKKKKYDGKIKRQKRT